MKLRVKSNGKEVSVSKEVFDKMTPDQKRSYIVLDKDDEVVVKDQVAKNKAPETGDKK